MPLIEHSKEHPVSVERTGTGDMSAPLDFNYKRRTRNINGSEYPTQLSGMMAAISHVQLNSFLTTKVDDKQYEA